jgi:hypothetical protein
MARPDVFVTDLGTRFRYRFMEDGAAVDLTGVDSVVYRWVSPDRASVFETEATVIDAEEGLAEYVTLADHWQGMSGLWHLYPQVVVTEGSAAHTATPKGFRVVAVPSVTP